MFRNMELGDNNEMMQEEVVLEDATGHNMGSVVYTDHVNGLMLTIDPNQHNYSQIPVSQHHQYGNIVMDNVSQSEVVLEAVSENTITPYVSHHDYITSMAMEPIDSRAEINRDPLQQQNLVIEEVVEQEVVGQSNQDLINSKPLTAMYLQATGPVSRDNMYIATGQVDLSLSPLKYSTTSNFDVRAPQQMPADIGCTEDLVEDSKDGLRMKFPYNSSSCMYTSNIGTLPLKADSDGQHFGDKSKMESQRYVGAILAASEAIKHQDIASEVEIGTCEVEISSPMQNGKKRKPNDKRSGIDDDIEQIRKAASTVAHTLKGMSKSERDGKKRRKPRIKLTLTKAGRGKREPTTSYLTEDEVSIDERDLYDTDVQQRRKQRQSEKPDVIYQCEYCDKQFKTREKVKWHAKTHTDERSFVCQECGCRFKRKEHLVRHYRRHTNDRPFTCMECGKSYFRLESLKRHSFLHSGEKPFECSMCEMAFSRHDRLLKHSLVHDK